MTMTDRTPTSLRTLALAAIFAGVALSCLIPDRDIQVVPLDPCGELWRAHTSGAYGFNAVGQQTNIVDEDDNQLGKDYCLDPAQAAQMLDQTSDLYAEVYHYIVDTCRDRAYEMGLVDSHDTCVSHANVAYVEPCYREDLDCSAGETGADGETSGGEDPGLDDLDLAYEIQLDGAEYLVSQHLIDVALTDTAGLLADGTRATLVVDPDGLAYGFEIGGVAPSNLGHALGLQNGDVITEVAGLPTAGYEDLIALANTLWSAKAVAVAVLRGGEDLTLRYRRSD